MKLQNNNLLDIQINSELRVSNFGEVFTAEREVNAMLDLVKQETERIESKFLEPACGTGNFLAKILEKKLKVVEKRYSKSQIEYERYSTHALSSIYGIEILKDNVQICRSRLLGIFTHFYIKNCKKKLKPELLQSAEFILERNILWGDALSLRTPDVTTTPIIFTEWSRPFNDSRFKRREYYFKELTPNDNFDLFNQPLKSDEGNAAFLPQDFKDYPLKHMLKLYEH